MISRRKFIRDSSWGTLGLSFALANTAFLNACNMNKLFFKISLAEWSLHRSLFNGEMSHLDFPAIARREYDIEAVEYVSTFFKGTGNKYLNELFQQTKAYDVKSVLIMVDREGDLGDLYEPSRIQAVERHYKWIEAAKFLGCHSIRVNARGEGSAKEVAKAAVDGLSRLSEEAAKENINVLVENHGGYSSNGQWLAQVMEKVNMPNCGTLPDFGNFCIHREEIDGEWQCTESYDPYQGVKELMPYAKGVSAKSHDFDKKGNETELDYEKLLKIVYNASYEGYIGIEYEGNRLSEKEGIKATKALLEKVGQTIS
jgi:sugar phosphate isomerase/epimerase